MGRAIILAVLTLFLGVFPPLLPAQEPPPATTASSNVTTAQTAYQEGKRLYDQKDYAGARKKFGEAARLEPNNPRWQYNLGLVYRQLDNFQAARQAFLRARSLDPNYKSAEIDQKLKSMGFNPETSSADQPASSRSQKQASPKTGKPLEKDTETFQLDGKKYEVPSHARDDAQEPVAHEEPEKGGIFGTVLGLLCCLGLPLLLIAGIVLVVRRLMKKPDAQDAAIDPQQLVSAEARLDEVATRLTRVEHALRLGEHPDLRNLLEHASRNEQAAWKALEQVRSGQTSAFNQLQRTASEAAAASQRAVELAQQVYGDQAFAGAGERVGCFFCARPLANPDYRRHITLKRGDSQDEVIACPDCAAQAERGESPAIRTGNDGSTHWSEIPDYDPYAMRHGPSSQMRRVEAWRYEPRQPMSTLAKLAAGGALLGVGALAGAGIAKAASYLFDLDAARHTGLEHDALNEAALQAGNRRDRNFNYDHS